MTKCRPEIDDSLIIKIKMKFPETALMGIAETVEWALRKLLNEKVKKMKKNCKKYDKCKYWKTDLCDTNYQICPEVKK